MRRRNALLEPGGELRCPADDVPAVDGRCPRCNADLRGLAAVQGLAQRLYEAGIMLAREGRLDEGAERLAAAVGLDPKLTGARVALGQVLARRGRCREARLVLEAAVVRDPADERARGVLRALDLSRSRRRMVVVLAAILGVGATAAAVLVAEPWSAGSSGANVPAARGALAANEVLAGVRFKLRANGSELGLEGAVENEAERQLALALVRPFTKTVDDSKLVVSPTVELSVRLKRALRENSRTADVEVTVLKADQGARLVGTVASEAKRSDVINVVRSTRGVPFVDAEDLVVAERPNPAVDLVARTQAALKENPATTEVKVRVVGKGLGVRIVGTVVSKKEHRAVIRISRGVPGVALVDAENLSSSGRSYVVRPGDSLSSIAVRFYGNEKLWRIIFEANRDRLASPDLLYPGQVLTLPPVSNDD